MYCFSVKSTPERITHFFVMCMFQWNSGTIVKMGWTIMEDLLFVQDDGVVLVYDMFLTFKRTFSMGQVRY